MIQKSDIQKSRMLVNVLRLLERREAIPLMAGMLPKRRRGQGRL
jgi:hypothetical protein